jgi:hypothetical protein
MLTNHRTTKSTPALPPYISSSPCICMIYFWFGTYSAGWK